MKKREIMSDSPARHFAGSVAAGFAGSVGAAGSAAWIGGGRAELRLLGIDLGAGDCALDALGHDPVARIEPGFDDPVGPLAVAGLDVPALDDVVRPHHQEIAPLLARPERHIGHENCLVQLLDRRAHPDEETGQQSASLVVEDGRGLPACRSRRPPAARRSPYGPTCGKPSSPCSPISTGMLERSVVRNSISCLGVVDLDPKNLRLAHGEIDVNRVELDDGRELGRRSEADERALVDEVAGDDPVERRGHRRVVEVDLGRLDGGLAFITSACRLFGFRLPLLDRGLAGEIVLAERGLALVFGLVVGPASPDWRQGSPWPGRVEPGTDHARCRTAWFPL